MRDYPQGGRVPEWPKGTGCKPVGVSLRRFESFRAQSGQASNPRLSVRSRPFVPQQGGVPGTHRPSILLCGFSLPRYTAAALQPDQDEPGP